MLKSYVKRVSKRFSLSTLYESNIIIFSVLKYSGVCDMHIPGRSRNKRLWLVIVLGIILYYFFGLYDNLNYGRFIQYENVSDQVEYAGQFAQLSIGLVLTINIQFWFFSLINKLDYFYGEVQKLDLKLCGRDSSLIYRTSLIRQFTTFVFGLFNIGSLAVYFGIRNAGLLGQVRGFILNTLYCLPYIQINAFLYLYISILYLLYQRFTYINDNLKSKFKSLLKKCDHNPLYLPQVCDNIYEKVHLFLKIHDELSDLMENINREFGILAYVCLILDFVWTITDSYSIITTLLLSSNIEAESVFMSFLFWWQAYNQIGMFVLPVMAEKCVLQVRK